MRSSPDKSVSNQQEPLLARPRPASERRQGRIWSETGEALMGLRAALVLMFALAACQTAPPVPPSAAPTALPSYRFVDLSDDFLALYDRTEGQPTADRVAAFKAEIVP